MRFSPGCACCEFDCDGCCLDLPNTLTLVLTPVGGASCGPCLDPPAGTITLTSLGPSGSGHVWEYTNTNCNGTPFESQIDISFACDCVLGTFSFQIGLSEDFAPDDDTCTIQPGAGALLELQSCSPFLVSGQTDTIAPLSESGGGCAEICPGGITFNVEIFE